MSLDPTARESNIKDSVKKFLVDNLAITEGINLSFDRFLDATELLKTAPPTVNRWISVVFGDMVRDVLGIFNVDLYCCTRQDPEGFRLSQLCDTVVGYLVDGNQTDGMRRVNLYRSRQSGSWTLIGALLIVEIIESREMIAPDKSKYKMITAVLRWSAKV